MLDTWHRLERVIKWTGLSVNSFALNIGLKRSENLYQIKKGNNGISRDLATLITTKYPSVSKAWLLTGEGEMFVEQVAASASQAGVPYYGMDILAGGGGSSSGGRRRDGPSLAAVLHQHSDIRQLRHRRPEHRDGHAARDRARSDRDSQALECRVDRARRVLPGSDRAVQGHPHDTGREQPLRAAAAARQYAAVRSDRHRQVRYRQAVHRTRHYREEESVIFSSAGRAE